MRRRASSAARSVVGEVGPVRRAARSASAPPKEEVAVLILTCCCWLVAIVEGSLRMCLVVGVGADLPR